MNENILIPMELNEDILVVQANELIRSRQEDFTLLESKLIRLVIGQILKNDTDLRTYVCRITDLSEYLGIDRQYLYSEVQELSKSLIKKSIFIIDKSKKKRNGEYNYKAFHWVDYFEYNEGIITIKLSESLKPHLIGLNKRFTIYGYANLQGLPTPNSIRLYELIASYQSMILAGSNELRFSVEELKCHFNCEKKYPNTSDFVKYIIDASIKAIQLKGSLRITYSLERKGRKITHIVFKIHPFTDLEYTRMVEQLREKENE